MPSHYLNQCWHIDHWSPGNIFQWNWNKNTIISIQENVFETVICEMSAILSQPQCVNSTPPSATYMRHWTRSALVQIMACRLFGAKPLPEPMLTFREIRLKFQNFSYMKMHLKMLCAKWRPFFQGGDESMRKGLSGSSSPWFLYVQPMDYGDTNMYVTMSPYLDYLMYKTTWTC